MELQLTSLLQIENILPDTQSGFRADHSCTTALLDACDDIIEVVDQNTITALILLDFSKALY